VHKRVQPHIPETVCTLRLVNEYKVEWTFNPARRWYPIDIGCVKFNSDPDAETALKLGLVVKAKAMYMQEHKLLIVED
jgi:hypothetical protein